ncbi:MAG: hypothetical protein ACI8VE_001313 [Natrialbaceae archaeon]|jgi:uncharacterized protein with PIN domain
MRGSGQTVVFGETKGQAPNLPVGPGVDNRRQSWAPEPTEFEFAQYVFIRTFIARDAVSQVMARCPACDSEIDHVIAEKIELTGIEDVIEETTQKEGYAIATLCPDCKAIIGI